MTRPSPGPGAAPADPELANAIGRALDALLHALELEPLGDDRFRAASEPARFDRVFGGQVLAQALLAAARTVPGNAPAGNIAGTPGNAAAPAPKLPHSLHAYFVEVGTPEALIELAVERIRDGRSVSMRRVVATQGERTLLTLMASFHAGAPGPELAGPAPEVPPPGSLPALQDWVPGMPDAGRAQGQVWVDLPPPLELRIGEAPTFLGGSRASGARAHWMRLPRDVGDDPLLHAALLAYASDYLLLDMVFRSHPGDLASRDTMGFSLDHAIWLHRPVRMDQWLLYVQETEAIHGERGLVRGRIHDGQGRLIATVMQEELARERRPRA